MIGTNPLWVRWSWIILVSALLINSQPGIGIVTAQQETTPQEKAQELLARLTPEERVGQLFLVTFVGNDVDEDSQIYDLIVNHHIGGAVLLAANDNIVGEDTLEQILTMNRQLQLNRWTAAQQPQTNPDTGETKTLHYIPLFIGTYQEGDGPPYDQILNGLTVLPNPMASGATWNTDLAQEVGSVLGAELAALGINLLIGPSLDVLETPKLIASNDLGTRTFGGDPFWVGEMGQAYITGVHQGSDGRIATIAKHFPGNGGADRPTEEEVATVRKSLDQLTKIDLVPFFGVTGNAPTIDATTDGLLASHIRYQGFQENIRATTRPVSFDPQAFNQLMSLPALARPGAFGDDDGNVPVVSRRCLDALEVEQVLLAGLEIVDVERAHDLLALDDIAGVDRAATISCGDNVGGSSGKDDGEGKGNHAIGFRFH